MHRRTTSHYQIEWCTFENSKMVVNEALEKKEKTIEADINMYEGK
jgi:hypothetical protein